MSDHNDDDYKVGYGKPPKNTRFQPGTSGNPSGERKGSGSGARSVSRVLNRLVLATIDGKRKKVPVSEAVALGITQRALAGDLKAGLSLLKMMANFQDLEAAEEDLQNEELSAETTKRAIEFVDFLDIAEALEVLGHIIRDPEGRPRLATAMLEVPLARSMEGRNEPAVEELRLRYLEGCETLFPDAYREATEKADRARRKMKMFRGRR